MLKLVKDDAVAFSVPVLKPEVESLALGDLKRAIAPSGADGDVPVAAAEKLAAVGKTLVGGALEIRKSKAAEAVQAWLEDHADRLDRVMLSGARTYPAARVQDLKKAVASAGAELDDAARFASNGQGMPRVVAAVYQVARGEVMGAAPVPSRRSVFDWVEERPWWQVALGTLAATGGGYLAYRAFTSGGHTKKTSSRR